MERQIGRLLEKNRRAGRFFNIPVRQEGRGKKKRLRVWWRERKKQREPAMRMEGHSRLRTNLVGGSPEQLWKACIQLTQAESACRTEKTELKIRPIWHQLQERVQAHILFSFLAYAMWKTLEMWMERAGLGNGPRTVLEEMARLKLGNVTLPTPGGRDLLLRCVTQAGEGPRILLQRLGLKIPHRLGRPQGRDRMPKMEYKLKT